MTNPNLTQVCVGPFNTYKEAKRYTKTLLARMEGKPIASTVITVGNIMEPDTMLEYLDGLG